MKKYFIAFILLLLMPLKGGACLYLPSVEQMVEESDVIFNGKVTSLKCKNNRRKIKLLSRDIWKGNVHREYSISEDVKDCTKDHGWKLTHKYYVFANYTDQNKASKIKVTSPNTCGSSYWKINMFWDEWDQKTKYRKTILHYWFKFVIKQGWYTEDILKYWSEYYYKLGKPKHSFTNSSS